MDGTTAESRPSANNLQHAAQPLPQPRKKRPEDFKFGKILGEGSFSTVSMCCHFLLHEHITPVLGLRAGTHDLQAVFFPGGGPRFLLGHLLL